MKELRETIRNANLTKTQKMIAKFILDNSADACFMTSTEIALKLGVSESSVIRFSRSLGYNGFMDFQKSLRRDYQDKVLSISSSITVPSQRIAKRAKLDDSAEYLKRHLKNSAKNLESIFVNNTIQTFEEAAKAWYGEDAAVRYCQGAPVLETGTPISAMGIVARSAMIKVKTSSNGCI